MNDILPILTRLAATNSRIEKESILISEKDNDLLKRFFEATNNPFRTYNIKQIPEYKCANEFMGSPLSKAIDQLYIFEDRVLTGNAAHTKLSNILSSLSGEDADVFTRIIKKDANCGIGVATINKIWPGLIPTTVYMGATAMSDAALEKLDWLTGVYAQNKEDGQFLFTMCKDDKAAKHFGRSGKEYDFKGAFDYLAESFPGCRIDGEIRVWNPDFTGFMHRKASNGYTNKFQVGKKAPNVDVNRLCYIVWDVVPYNDAIKGHCDVPYRVRLNCLVKAVKDARAKHSDSMLGLHSKPEVRLVHTELVHSLESAKEMFRRVKAKGEEGLILKEMEAAWQDGKPDSQVKLKNASECEMKIIGFQEHKKEKGRLGAFILASADGKIRTNCGSGLEKDESFEIWQNRDSYLNGVVSIKFESVIWKDGEDLLSMNLPIFIEVREDKDQADNLATIIQIWEADTGCTIEEEISSKL